MTVTEVAFMRAASSPAPETLKKCIIDCNEILQIWVQSHPEVELEGGWLFQQVQDPAILLMAAKWKDVQAHEKWAASGEVAQVMAQMMPLVARKEDGTPDIDMWHLDGDIFGSPLRAGENTSLLDSPVISFVHYVMPADQKLAFEAAKPSDLSIWLFNEEIARPYAIRDAWKVEGEESGTVEWAHIAGWDSVEHHKNMSEDASMFRLRELISLVARFEMHHYRRLL